MGTSCWYYDVQSRKHMRLAVYQSIHCSRIVVLHFAVVEGQHNA